jgi:2',3'-cyclic-nucleotide 2'-phosphodiesterase (5'-nucleotidase family)
MNASGIDYVCIGNHENDIKLTEMQKRMKESKFTWINTNMPNLALAPDMEPLPQYKVIEVEANGHKRRIGLLGLNTEDPKCVPPGRFGNCDIDPVNDTAARFYKKLKDTEKVDTVIPLTHQYMPEDRRLAEMNVGFPVIIGGHDHSEFHEVVNGCHIIKVGMNMEKIGIVDVEWPSPHAVKPNVTVTVKDATSYPRDPEVEVLISKHKYVLEQMVHIYCFHDITFFLSVSIGKSCTVWTAKVPHFKLQECSRATSINGHFYFYPCKANHAS